MNLDWLKSHDISIDRSNYDLIYTAPLRESGTVTEQLEKLSEQFNLQKDDPQNVRFMNLDWLKSHDISIDRSNYDLIYTAPLRESGTVPEQLEKLYEQFNLQKPADFHNPSMSVSDIVAINQDGKVSCHY